MSIKQALELAKSPWSLHVGEKPKSVVPSNSRWSGDRKNQLVPSFRERMRYDGRLMLKSFHFEVQRQTRRLKDLAMEVRKDFRRHGGSARYPATWIMVHFRVGKWALQLPTPLKWLGGKLYGVTSVGLELLTSVSLPRESTVGSEVHLIHPYNITIHPDVFIGDRVGIMHEVTLGTTIGRMGAPHVESDVFIGAGAKIIGPVRIGAGARIGANAVVTHDVPCRGIAVGVPARVIGFVDDHVPVSSRVERKRAVSHCRGGDASRIG